MGGVQGVGIDVLVHDNGGCLGCHDCEGGSCARVWMGCGRDAQLVVELARVMVVVVMVYEVGRQAVSYARRDAVAVLGYASRNAVRPSKRPLYPKLANVR